jgi:hypothetical protein
MFPQQIGRYEIKGELGRGGMAIVYQAYDPRFERDVAIKILPHEFLYDPSFRARFEREARTIARLEHFAIVPVHDFGEHDGQPYLVMRYMSGGSLFDRISKGWPLSLETAAHIVERTAAALDTAHHRAIIHRDVKPGNILFDQNGQPYLTDFGIVKLTEATAQLTGSGMVGTPAYMAPEMARPGGVTRLIDVYALGVTLYQMLAGSLPYDADTPMGLLMAHVTEPIPDVREATPGLSDDVQVVLERALAKDPLDRYQRAGELADALGEIATGAVSAEEPALAEEVDLRAAVTVPEPAVDEVAETVPEPEPEAVIEGASLVQEMQPLPETGPKSQAAIVTPTAPRPARRGSNLPWIVGGGIAVLAVILAIVMVSANQRRIAELEAAAQALEDEAYYADQTAQAIEEELADATALAEETDAASTAAARDAAATSEARAASTQQAERTAEANAQATADAVSANMTATVQALEAAAARHAGWPGWPLFVYDFFDSNINDWRLGESSNEYGVMRREIVGGKFAWEVEAHQGVNAFSSLPDRFVSDAYITVEGRQLTGPSGAEYGIIFRRDDHSFYWFRIAEDSLSYAFSKLVDSQWTNLIPWTDTDAIRAGDWNRLTVLAEGSHFTFYINEQYVAAADDDDLGRGTAGIAVEFHDEADATFEFDNYEVYTP